MHPYLSTVHHTNTRITYQYLLTKERVPICQQGPNSQKITIVRPTYSFQLY